MTVQSVGPRKTRKQLLSEWRHAEVLDAARGVFGQLGYPGTNVEAIAKAAGIAKGTIYLYFKSKEEIFAAVLARDMEALTDRTIAAVSAVGPFPERLRVFLNLRVEYLLTNQDFLRIFFAEFGSRATRSKPVAEAIDKKIRRGLEFLRTCVEQAIANGEIRAVPPEAAAHAISDLARGFAERQLNGWTELTLAEDMEFTRSMMLRGLQL